MNNVINLDDWRKEMKIKIEGSIYNGTAREIVLLMKGDGLFTASQTKGEYMNGVSDRLFQLKGLMIRVTSPVVFLNDLCIEGLVTRAGA